MKIEGLLLISGGKTAVISELEEQIFHKRLLFRWEQGLDSIPLLFVYFVSFHEPYLTILALCTL